MAQKVGQGLGTSEVLLREMQTGMITVAIPYDQLSRTHGAMKDADPRTHEILLIESQSMMASRTWHAERLFLVLSALEHFAAELTDEGFTVHRMEAPSLREGILKFTSEYPSHTIIATQPRSRSLQRVFIELEIDLFNDDSFLTSRSDFEAWAQGRKNLTQEHFYRWQRTRLGYLMDGSEPLGGAWNFDQDNRLPPPKPGYKWPTPITFAIDSIDQAVAAKIEKISDSHWGSISLGTWATTRAGAIQQLEWFLEHSLNSFGPYEDAMPKDSWAGCHSMLSPYLNLGLISPIEVCEAAIARFEQGGVPINSIEGFIRQIIGWREYINGVYWLFPEEYQAKNELDAQRPLLPLFENPDATHMNCMKSVISDVEARGWVHHIPRLMLMSNLALLADVNPQEFLGWMRRSFIDAADWVMVPNVIGMGMHADNGTMMTKPYIAGGAYIKRMGQFCSGCKYKPTERTGETACPFTTLYWDFLDRNQAAFAKNHRMVQQFAGLRKLKDIDAVRLRAARVLSGLEEGTI